MRFRAATAALLTAVLTWADASAWAFQAPPTPSPTPLPTAAPGWKVETLLEAPKLRHPSVVCAAPDGRVFVAEDPMDMGESSSKPVDRILCLHPDGRLTVFAEGLYAVFGLAYLDGKVYVHHSPKFSVFTDDGSGTGRDRRDIFECTHPAPWLSGFNDHIPSSMRLGMDGYFYMSTGDKGIFGLRGPDGRACELKGGGVIRFRPDGTGLEVFSSGTRNHLDVALTAEDEVFTYDNTDDGNGWWTRVTHMVDGGFYGYPYDYKPRRPYTLWMISDFGGGSPCGAVGYNDDALPDALRGSVFLCEWGRGQLINLRLSREGGSFKIVERTDVLTRGKSGSEFRPVGICVAPDGSGFYVTDWAFGGWKKKDLVCGRLLKLTYTGAPSSATARPDWYVPAAMGRPFQAETADLIAALSHPAQSVRLVAQRRLAERGTAVVPELEKLLADHAKPAHARWHAIWALDAIDGGKNWRWGPLSDPEPSVRRQAARQLATHPHRNPIALERLLADADGGVRFHAATALGRAANAAHVDPLLRALGTETDLFVRYALFTALHRIGLSDKSAEAWTMIGRGLRSANPAVSEATLFAFRDAYDARAVAELAGFVSDAKQPIAGRVAALVALAELHRQRPAWDGKWWGTQPVKGAPPAKTVEWPGTPAVLAAVRAGLDSAEPELRAAAAEAVAIVRDAESLSRLLKLLSDGASDAGSAAQSRAVLRALAALRKPESADAVAAVLSSDKTRDAGVLSEAVLAAGAIRGAKLIAALRAFAESDAAPAEPLAAALAQLGSLKLSDAVPTLARRLTHADAKVRIAAVEGLSLIGGESAVKALVPLLTEGNIESRRAVVTALGTLKHASATEPLLRVYAEQKELRFEAVAALAAVPDVRALDAYIEGLAGRNASVRDACGKAVAVIAAEALPRIEAKLDTPGAVPATALAELRKIYATVQPIRNWHLVGPFHASKPIDIEIPATAEAADKLLAKPANLGEGRTAKWKSVRTDRDGMGDLTKWLGQASDVSAMAVAFVDSPTARAAEIRAGVDDGLELWVNGVRVLDELKRVGGYNANEFRLRVELKPGRNVFVARVSQSGGGWSFSVGLTGAPVGKLFAQPGTATPANPAEFAEFALKTVGDPARGARLFADVKGLACIKCHQVRVDAGAELGPNLAGIGAKYDRAKLIESVLYPSRQILDGYHVTVVQTDDDKVITGLVRAETPDELTLVDAEGRKHVLKKSELAARKQSDKSLMPEGLQQGLSRQDFADVIGYLETLKEKPPEPKPQTKTSPK